MIIYRVTEINNFTITLDKPYKKYFPGIKLYLEVAKTCSTLERQPLFAFGIYTGEKNPCKIAELLKIIHEKEDSLTLKFISVLPEVIPVLKNIMKNKISVSLGFTGFKGEDYFIVDGFNLYVGGE